MMRLGLIGLDSSHADLVIGAVAGGLLGPHVCLTALCLPRSEWAGDVDIARADVLREAAGDLAVLRGEASAPQVLAGAPSALAERLRGVVDAVIVADRDARAHAGHAEPFLQAGIPVLVDKPFVLDVREAAHLVDLAERNGVVLTSYSPLRWAPEVVALGERYRSSSHGIVVTSSGPGVARSPFGGLPFYAVHAVEMGLAVARGHVVDVTRATRDGVSIVSVRTQRDVVTIALVEPVDGEQTPFHLSVTAGDGRSDVTIDLAPNYLVPGLRAFCASVVRGIAPVPGRSLVDVVRVLEFLR